MIDPHVHLRDWGEARKETVRHGLEVARRAGLDAVFEMPNTDPPLVSRQVIERRLELAAEACREVPGVVHGLYGGLTTDADQIREVVSAHAALFPRVVGLKLFAGHSTGGMGVTDETAQRQVWRELARRGYRGVVAVHAEKEGLFRRRADGAADWDPARPRSHAVARPPESEVASVEDQVRFAAEEGFRGVLHVAHVSVPASLAALERARGTGLPFRVSVGLTPQHALLAAEDMDGRGGLLLKVNPPLRPRGMEREMLGALLAGRIDWVETDHAPHTMEDKTLRHASGLPVLPFYPRFVALLAARMAAPMLESATHRRIEELFGFEVPARGRAADVGRSGEYPYDPFASIVTPPFPA